MVKLSKKTLKQVQGDIFGVLCACCVLLFSTAAHASPNVVVSIKPLHTLASAIMNDVGEPKLLLDAGASPHISALKPSQRKALENADVVFYIDPSIENFMAKTVVSLNDPEKAMALGQADGVVRLPMRDEHAHHHEHHHDHDHEETSYDMHVWMDPANALIMAQAMANQLIEADPANKAAYGKNLQSLQEAMPAILFEVREILAPIKGVPLLVFHDAYAYFERAFDLRHAGVIQAQPGVPLSAKRMAETYEMLNDGKAGCLVSEPQFDAQMVQLLADEFGLPHVVVDPLGGSLDADAGYGDFLKAMAESLRGCRLPLTPKT